MGGAAEWRPDGHQRGWPICTASFMAFLREQIVNTRDLVIDHMERNGWQLSSEYSNGDAIYRAVKVDGSEPYKMEVCTANDPAEEYLAILPIGRGVRHPPFQQLDSGFGAPVRVAIVIR